MAEPLPSRFALCHQRPEVRADGPGKRCSRRAVRPPAGLPRAMDRLFTAFTVKRGIRGIRAFTREAHLPRSSVSPVSSCFARSCSRRRSASATLRDPWRRRICAAWRRTGQASHRARASCAIYWRSLEILAGRVKWIDWGGSAGTSLDPGSSLASFKRGWASCVRQTFLCCRILDGKAYAALVAERGCASTDYFPAYRDGEP